LLPAKAQHTPHGNVPVEIARTSPRCIRYNNLAKNSWSKRLSMNELTDSARNTTKAIARRT